MFELHWGVFKAELYEIEVLVCADGRWMCLVLPPYSALKGNTFCISLISMISISCDMESVIFLIDI